MQMTWIGNGDGRSNRWQFDLLDSVVLSILRRPDHGRIEISANCGYTVRRRSAHVIPTENRAAK